MQVMIVIRDNDKIQRNNQTQKEKDQNIWKDKIIDGRKLKINLLKENKDNIVKHTLKWWVKKEQPILTGISLYIFRLAYNPINLSYDSNAEGDKLKRKD